MSHPLPVVTKETTQSLEDIVKQRVLDEVGRHGEFKGPGAIAEGNPDLFLH